MLKKLSLVLSVLAALGFAVAISAPADAKQPQKNTQFKQKIQVNKTTKFKQTTIKVNPKFQSNKSLKIKSSKFIIGQKYKNHTFFGHHRHRWHGRWYDYGVGECWILIDDEWFWNELVCPL